ncbi:hypothetical protein OIV83_003971 [Microbotryomycetes sp. JL201]|nr:hypothetical protein OIV83_003971 [Microbotryomycetes sp. JL201]
MARRNQRKAAEKARAKLALPPNRLTKAWIRSSPDQTLVEVKHKTHSRTQRGNPTRISKVQEHRDDSTSASDTNEAKSSTGGTSSQSEFNAKNSDKQPPQQLQNKNNKRVSREYSSDEADDAPAQTPKLGQPPTKLRKDELFAYIHNTIRIIVEKSKQLPLPSTETLTAMECAWAALDTKDKGAVDWYHLRYMFDLFWSDSGMAKIEVDLADLWAGKTGVIVLVRVINTILNDTSNKLDCRDLKCLSQWLFSIAEQIEIKNRNDESSPHTQSISSVVFVRAVNVRDSDWSSHEKRAPKTAGGSRVFQRREQDDMDELESDASGTQGQTRTMQCNKRNRIRSTKSGEGYQKRQKVREHRSPSEVCGTDELGLERPIERERAVASVKQEKKKEKQKELSPSPIKIGHKQAEKRRKDCQTPEHERFASPSIHAARDRRSFSDINDEDEAHNSYENVIDNMIIDSFGDSDI